MPQFIDDLETIVNYIGVDKPGIAFDLAEIRWESQEHLEAFLAEITAPQDGAANG